MTSTPDLSFSLIEETLTLKRTRKDREEKIEIENARLKLALTDPAKPNSSNKESLVIRGNHPHHVLHMAGFAIEEYEKFGLFEGRPTNIKWSEAFADIQSKIDDKMFPHSWIAVFCNGKYLYKSEDTATLLDTLEQIDSKAKNYDETLFKFESSMGLTKNPYHVDHQTKTFYVLDYDAQEKVIHSGVLCPKGQSSTNITMIVSEGESHAKDKDRPYYIYPSVKTAACLMEGSQLAYEIGIWQAEKEFKKKVISEDRQRFLKQGPDHLITLRQELNHLKSKYTVRFRPEEPVFEVITEEGQKVIQKKYDPKQKRKA